MRCDLHLHTCRSDGAHATNDVLRMARKGALDLISITDHDSVQAYDDIDPEAQDSLVLLPGVEITTAPEDGDEELHILGYFPFGFTSRFKAFLTQIQQERRERMRAGVERLAEDGIAIVIEDVLERCGGRVISRAHLAQTMVDKRIVPTYADAFRDYIGSHRAVVPKPTIRPARAIDIIRRERGISIWAHPMMEQLDRRLGALVEMGLNGIEVYTRKRTGPKLQYYESVAADLRLLKAGGSDWHGHDPRDKLGRFDVPSDSISQLLSFFDLPQLNASRE